MTTDAAPPSLAALARTFLRLGCTSFGGPTAHIGYLRQEWVVRRSAVAAERFDALVALCQLLPGPASSQLVYALGRELGGTRGAWIASACFTLPSALLMTAAALPMVRQWIDAPAVRSWRHGLLVAASAVVAHAVIGMARSLGRSTTRWSIAAAAFVMLMSVRSPGWQPLVIALGALGGLLLEPRTGGESPKARPTLPRHAVALLASVPLLLIVLPMVTRLSGLTPLGWCERFFRAGALVFGGGHVVLPLLRHAVVDSGALDGEHFLTGYGLAQLVPGPLFTFAAWLGTAITPAPWSSLGGLGAMLALFLPGWLLVAGALPLWSTIHTLPRARRAASGAGAAVVGLLAATLVGPVAQESMHGATDLLLALVATALLVRGRLPMVAVVLATAVAAGGLSR